MSLTLSFQCEKCTHYRGHQGDFVPKCDALPNGIREKYNVLKTDFKALKECNNGIGYKEKK